MVTAKYTPNVERASRKTSRHGNLQNTKCPTYSTVYLQMESGKGAAWEEEWGRYQDNKETVRNLREKDLDSGSESGEGQMMGTEINSRDIRVCNDEPFLSSLEFIRVFSK